MRQAAEVAEGMGADSLRRLLLWHLPGTCQAVFATPYLDPSLYVSDSPSAYRIHFATYQRFAPEDAVVAFSAARHTQRGVRFRLDCRPVLESLHRGSQAGARTQLSVLHGFHPYLPLVVSTFQPTGAMVIHYWRA